MRRRWVGTSPEWERSRRRPSVGADLEEEEARPWALCLPPRWPRRVIKAGERAQLARARKAKRGWQGSGVVEWSAAGSV